MAARDVERVLIVEDDAALRATLERALAPRFAEVRSATNVAEAVAFLAGWRPDLLLLDVELPDGTAIDVMRAAVAGDALPLAIAMSGAAGPDQSFELAQLGVRTYLKKPLDLPSLERALSDAIENPLDVTPQIRAGVGQRPIHEVQEEVRTTMLREAVSRAGGSKRGAAKLLQISRQLVQHMLRRLDD